MRFVNGVLIPQGIEEVKSHYGDIKVAPVVGGGYKIFSPSHWEEQNCVVVRDFPGLERPLYVHKKIVEPLRAALTAAQIRCPDYKIRTIGCFNPRMKRTDGGRLSLHAWAVAVDINADTNPQSDRLVTDMPTEFVRSFEEVGWVWGGKFRMPDAMHYQLAEHY